MKDLKPNEMKIKVKVAYNNGIGEYMQIVKNPLVGFKGKFIGNKFTVIKK